MRLKKSVKRVLVLILVVLIAALGGIIYYFGFYKKPTKEIKIIKEIPEYGYKLKENESGLYKKKFQELEKVLKEENVDEEEYAKVLSELFVIDFYSLDNKIAKTDVGGIDFVDDSIRSDFLNNAIDTYYKYVESDMYDQREQNLPEVSSVEVEDISKDVFEYGDNTDSEAYFVSISWKYKRKQSGYQDNAKLIFVHKDKKLVLVELK